MKTDFSPLMLRNLYMIGTTNVMVFPGFVNLVKLLFVIHSLL